MTTSPWTTYYVLVLITRLHSSRSVSVFLMATGEWAYPQRYCVRMTKNLVRLEEARAFENLETESYKSPELESEVQSA